MEKVYDEKIPDRLKVKVYENLVRSSMLYGLETIAPTKRQEAEINVAELRMLRFPIGVTRLDRIRNEKLKGQFCQFLKSLIKSELIVPRLPFRRRTLSSYGRLITKLLFTEIFVFTLNRVASKSIKVLYLKTFIAQFINLKPIKYGTQYSVTSPVFSST